MRFQSYFDHHAQIIKFGGTAEIVEIVQRVGSIFGDKLAVIIDASVSQRFNC